MVVADELRINARALASRWLWALLTTAAILITLAYQVNWPVDLVVGGGYDCPYLGPHEYCMQVPPKDPAWGDPAAAYGVSYRQTKQQSEILLPGLGNQPYTVNLLWAGAGETASTPVTVTINAQVFTATLGNDFVSSIFPTIRFGRTNADVRITIQSPQPVRVALVSLISTGTDLSVLVVPSLEVTLSLLASVLLLYLITYRVIYGRRVAAQQGTPPLALGDTSVGPAIFATPQRLATWVVALALAIMVGLLMFNRLSITSFAPQLAVVLLWAWLLAELVIVIGTKLAPQQAQYLPLLGGLFAFAFAVRFGGMVYPQFITSDLTFHAHHVDDMVRFFGGQGGNFYFDGALPNGTRVPYPNAYYVLLAPFEWLLGGTTEAGKLLLRFSSALLDASTVLLLYVLGRHFGAWVGLTAGLLYATGPAAFQLFSAGNHSNIFAQVMFIAALTAAVEYLSPQTRAVDAANVDTAGPAGLASSSGQTNQATIEAAAPSQAPSATRPTVWLLLYLLFFTLTSLGHYGMFIAAVGVTLAIATVWLVLSGNLRGRLWPLLGVFALGLIVAYLLYYVHFNTQIGTQIGGILSGKGRQSNGFDLPHLLTDIWRWQGWLVLPLAAVGIGLLLRRGWHDEARATRLVLGGWLLACIPLALTALFDRDTIRYNYLALPALCLCGGLTVQWLGQFRALRQGNWRVAGLIALIALALINVTLVWGDLIFNQYH